MRKETFNYLFIVVVQFYSITGKLIGDHICQEERRYRINETQHFIKNATIRHYKWCLNVPPRCSFYTVKPVNATRIVEKEVVDIVEACCPGFQENEDHYCRPVCPQCINGICKLGICECFAGFKGDKCNTECDQLEWGPNCKLQCPCERGTCNSTTGNCICPRGFTGNRCELMCQRGFYGDNCNEECKCGDSCHHITGICPTTTTVTTTITTTTVTNRDIITTTIPIDKVTESAENRTISEVQNDNFTLIKVDNNGKFISNDIEIEPKQESSTIPLRVPSIFKVEPQFDSHEKEDSLIKDDVLLKSLDVEIPPKIVDNGHNFLNDKSEKINFEQPTNNTNAIINSASAITAMTTVIIVLILAIILLSRYERKKHKIENERNKRCTHTICTHTDDFEEKITGPPICLNDIENSSTYSPIENKYTNTDSGKYTYDHLPSTANTPAIFIPEMFDIQTVSTRVSRHNLEPVYDEIPSRTLPVVAVTIPQSTESYKSSSLYVNTYAKTRL